MDDFGHNWAQLGDRKHPKDVTYVDGWGAGPFVILAGGKSFRFEDSDMFGPSLIKLNGDIKTNPWPPESSPFWRAHMLWRKQGKRVAEDQIECIWHEPKPLLVKRIAGTRHRVIVESGEDEGKIQEVGTMDATEFAAWMKSLPTNPS